MARRLKVLQVTAVDFTAYHLLRPLFRRLGEEGCQVQLACAPGPDLERLRGLGVRCWPVPLSRAPLAPTNARALWSLYRLMRRERFDVVHLHTPVAAALGRLAARWAGVPHVLHTVHGFYFHERTPPWARRALVGLERGLDRCCPAQLLCVSREDARTAVRERVAPPDRVRWIGNGVECQRFQRAQPPPGLRAALGLKAPDRVIGFVGRLVREKGILDLLRALAAVRRRVPQARLLVVGDALSSDRDQRTRRRVQRLLESLDLRGQVVFAGVREDVPELLKLMEVFTLPSHREGLPISILEAMAAGLPVVATDIRGCREEVVDGVTGRLVPVGDPSALAGALLGILQDEAAAHRMGAAGQRRVQREFDQRSSLERQMALYRGLKRGWR